MRRFFLHPPRRHGEVNYDREVSFLELFYDLVYVVIIGQAAHHLATHVSWTGLWDFAVVFGLIWLAWFNGTFWHEVHGREDGRSRVNIFIQMGLIALMAVYTSHATDSDGPAFATVYAVLFVWYTYQWWVVHRIDDPAYRSVTSRYLAAMVITIVLMGISTTVSDGARLAIWAAVVAAWVLGGIAVVALTNIAGFAMSLTGSMVERFGLFTIVVLGEVVIGVVQGLSEVESRSALTVTVAMLGLAVGMGLWWNYFDALGRHIPVGSDLRLATWMYVHLPLTASIAAAGAAMVSLVEHAEDSRTPAPTAWLLGGSVAVALLCVGLASRALNPDDYPPGLLARIPGTLSVGAALAVGVAALRPSPVLLSGSLALVLTAVWFVLVAQFFAAGGLIARDGEQGEATAT